MNPRPKIQLSSFEMELVKNTEWILTKNAVVIKAKHLLEALQEKQNEHLQTMTTHLPEEVFKIPAKISKGENYNGLPYLILDFPRFFDHKDIFAVRTMFWWGNFFSITLQLSGKFKILFAEKIINGYRPLKEKGFYVCVHEEQWEHHFDEYNYTEIGKKNQDDFANSINSNSFIKLANKIPLTQWDNAQDLLLKHFKTITEVLIA